MKNRTITIGNLDLRHLNENQLVHIAKIEGVHLFFEFWSEITPLNFSNIMFSDTIVLDIEQRKISEESISRTIVLFFNFKEFCFHWHFKDDIDRIRHSKRLSMKSIKYLIDQGYDIPLY